MARILSGPYVDGYLCEAQYGSPLKVIVFPVIFDDVLTFPVAEAFVDYEPFPAGFDVQQDSA